VGAALLGLNKGGGPRISSCAKMEICQMHVPSNLIGRSCSGRLRRRTPLGDSCLEIARSGGIQSCAPILLSDRLVSEGALRSSAGC
jgi:hypothetical protein